nr:hypothetical protein [uncultured Kingella sp.]
MAEKDFHGGGFRVVAGLGGLYSRLIDFGGQIYGGFAEESGKAGRMYAYAVSGCLWNTERVMGNGISDF